MALPCLSTYLAVPCLSTYLIVIFVRFYYRFTFDIVPLKFQDSAKACRTCQLFAMLSLMILRYRHI